MWRGCAASNIFNLWVLDLSGVIHVSLMFVFYMQFVLSDIGEQYCTCQSRDFYCCVKSAVNEVKFCNILWHVGDFFYHAAEFCKNFRKFHGTSQDLMSRGKSCALFIIYYSLCVLMLSRQCCWVLIFILSISLRIFTFMQLCDHFKILMKCVCMLFC